MSDTIEPLALWRSSRDRLMAYLDDENRAIVAAKLCEPSEFWNGAVMAELGMMVGRRELFDRGPSGALAGLLVGTRFVDLKPYNLRLNRLYRELPESWDTDADEFRLRGV